MAPPELGRLTEANLTHATLVISEPKVDKKNKTVSPGTEITTFTFQFNPKEYTLQTKAQWQSKQHKKGVRPPQFKGVSPATMSVEAFLDQRSMKDGDTVEQAVDTLLQCVQPTKQSIKSSPFPPVLTFSWGSKPRAFLGVATSVNAKYTMFAADGAPMRATCTLSLQLFEWALKKQNPTSGTPRIDRSYQVRMGDSLASIANEEYGDPDLWRAIALANGVVNPAAVPVGTHLLLPPVHEAARLLAGSR